MEKKETKKNVFCRKDGKNQPFFLVFFRFFVFFCFSLNKEIVVIVLSPLLLFRSYY